jgi:cytochrome c oxidase cbb3-type subunit 3
MGRSGVRGSRSYPGATLILIFILLATASCKREDRGYRVDPPSADTIQTLTLTDLRAGNSPTNAPVQNDYEQNAYAISQGQHLYNYFNCVGCHAHGGGDKGPALMDDKWIYGSRPEQIFATIVQGRPNGMPAFRGHIPDYQVWELVAYVRSLSGQVSKQAAPGREDHMQTTPQPPNSAATAQPKNESPNATEGTH